MFTDRQIRTHAAHLTAALLWGTSFALMAVAWAVDWIYLAGFAVIMSAAAGTMTVHGFFLSHREHLRTALMVTSSADVTPLDRG